MRPIALPQDRLEVDLSVQGPANALVSWPRGLRFTADSRRLVPIVPDVQLDALGRGVLTALTVLPAEEGALTTATIVAVSRGALPTGVTFTSNTPIAAVRVSRAGAFARELAYAIGPGIQAVERSRVVAEYVAQGDGLAATHRTQVAIRNERFVDTAEQLLAGWESRLRIPVAPTSSLADRRSLALGRLRGAFGGPESRVLSAIRAIDPSATIRNGKSLEVAVEPKKVYIFAVLLSVAVWNDTRKREQIAAIVRQMAPAHSLFNVATRAGFRCDDPLSLTDRDVLGA